MKNKKSCEALVFLVVFFSFFGYLSSKMGLANMMQTLMNTAHYLLQGTVWYLLGVMVLAGAVGNLLIEFGVISLLERVLSFFMRPLFGLPGKAAIAGLLTFLSDNPAVISLANDKKFSRRFKRFELVSLTNFGTAFGMGIIVVTSMAAMTDPTTGKNFFIPAVIGLLGAIAGAIISTRLMQRFIKHEPNMDEYVDGTITSPEIGENILEEVSEDSILLRLINSTLDGGKGGVSLGLSIIPGVLIITTLVMVVTYGAPADGVYTGGIKQGVNILPQLAELFAAPLEFLFGFKDDKLVAFPITALGSVGAALGTVKEFMRDGIVGGNEIAVFTSIGMCWSGYLSTHTAMLDTLNSRHLTTKALTARTIGGLAGGVFAHFIYSMIASFTSLC